MFRLTNLTRVAAIGAVVALAACESKKDVLGPHPLPTGDIFQSYVAIGNSITAGFQSNGILDSTQRQSFARLLAGQMGTQYHYASIAGRGCPPPIANGLTGALLGTGSTSTTCDLRAGSSVTDILNNVAVPGAISLDPTASTSPASNVLTTLILGGKTQVQRALDAKPTFTTIWIGNNDVLRAATTGYIVPTSVPTLAITSPGIVSTQAQFQANYDAMMKQLLDGAPSLKGVLIGVVQVSGVPLLSSGALIASNATIQAGISQAAGKPVTVNPNCVGSTALVNVPQLLGVIRANAHPATIACAKGSDPTDPRVGDAYVLDAGELTTLQQTVAGYNSYIQSKATASGFAYYDPNVLLAAQRASGAIPAFPNFGSPTATYGTLISLDGVHPAAAAHKLIANALIDAINAKYGTTLAPVP
ncbi:MAG: SGNH/GDSL hydrolase family protein [Gemmatimonadaceae bacterium]